MDYLNNIQLIKSIEKIQPSEKSMFFICPYKIITNNLIPFLTFLLYKQTINQQELCLFPYVHLNINIKNTINNIKTIINSINDENIFKGAIQYNDNFYLFYEIFDNNKIPEYDSNTVLFWTTIYEIVHLQYIFNIPIHFTTFSLFYSFPNLIHLYYFNEKIQFPQIIYNLEDNIINIFSNFNTDKQCYKVKHICNILQIKNIIRCILFEEFTLYNICNNVFEFNNINQLQIISE